MRPIARVMLENRVAKPLTHARVAIGQREELLIRFARRFLLRDRPEPVARRIGVHGEDSGWRRRRFTLGDANAFETLFEQTQRDAIAHQR